MIAKPGSPCAGATVSLGSDLTGAHGLYFCFFIFQKSQTKQSTDIPPGVAP